MTTDSRHAPTPSRDTDPRPTDTGTDDVPAGEVSEAEPRAGLKGGGAGEADGECAAAVNPSATGRAERSGAGVTEAPGTDGSEMSAGGAARAVAGPRFPSLRPSRAPHAAGPAGPPPPPASARFPDTPPTAGRDTAPVGMPPRPAQRPTVPPRPAPAETPSETTTRLRPVPPAPKAECAPGPRSGTGSTPSRTPETGTGSNPDPDFQAFAPRPRATVLPPVPPMPATRPPVGGHVPGAAALSPDPALSWSAPPLQGAARPVVSFGEPEGYDERMRARPLGARIRPRTAAAAACVVLGLGLIGGAVTGSWLTGDTGGSGSGGTFSAAAGLWHSVPVDDLFPPTVQGTGAGPGGADRTWTRIAVAPDSGCAHAFDPLLRKALAPVGCHRLLRATYTDATQSYVTTVGLLFTKADSAAMASLAARFKDEALDRRADLMPRPYAAKDTVAERFGAKQRASWTISVLTDAPIVAYAVSGWSDGRSVDTPQPAAIASEAGATTAPAQAGLGQEAQGLADRIERRLRKTVGSATETPS
ncbi:hypothetical protein [Streptomyces sp. NPDC001978]|uniref:hypothetical protein n=1 Tax=Streptomyces sp. NPDC001978 TaxID=3364627 RepID=UPI0036C7A7C3